MTEKQQWMVHPRTGLAHYTLLRLDPALSRMTICRLVVDDSWTPIEEPKRKCKNCALSVWMENADYTTLEGKLKALRDFRMKGTKNRN